MRGPRYRVGDDVWVARGGTCEGWRAKVARVLPVPSPEGEPRYALRFRDREAAVEPFVEGELSSSPVYPNMLDAPKAVRP